MQARILPSASAPFVLSTTHGPKPARRISAPTSTTPGLAAIAEIATTLATGESIAAVAPTVLASVNALLNGDEVAVWLGSHDERSTTAKVRLRRAWGVGAEVVDADSVA